MGFFFVLLIIVMIKKQCRAREVVMRRHRDLRKTELSVLIIVSLVD
jgi:hypothetical protein